MKFKDGQKIVCINAENSDKLVKGRIYTIKGNSYFSGGVEYVDLEGDFFEMFYASRFIKTLKEERKEKIEKIQKYEC